jgi:hypothetical protein
MLYYIFHNPHSPTQMSLDRYWDFKTPDGFPADGRDVDLIYKGRTTFFNPHNVNAPNSIIVKPHNLLLLDIPRSLDNLHHHLLKLAYTYWKAGKLHSFDLTDHPELFI